MGKKIVLTGVTFTDDTLPRLQDDAILPNAGALMLIEPAHPADPWGAGYPANLATVPNLAAGQLGSVLGIAPESDTLKPFVQNGTGLGTGYLIERSGKGGAHGIVSQVAMAGGNGTALRLPTALRQYLVDTTTNHLYVSLWARITRAPTTTDYLSVLGVNPSLGQSRATLAQSASGGVISPNEGLAEVVGMSVPMPRSGDGTALYMVATNAWRGSVPTDVNQISAYHPANWGEGFGGNGNARNKGTSWVFYRYYMEDLTVSGRTYDEVAAIDAALFGREVLTAGGRYHGDTWTSPATLP